MTDHQFLIVKTLLDNKGKHIGENNLRDLLKDQIAHKHFWEAYSPLYNHDIFSEDVLGNLEVTTIGLNEFNKENEKRIQTNKDEQVARTKLYHDASISKWKHDTFWPVFIGGLIGGVCGIISLVSELGIINLPSFQSKQTTTIQIPPQSTDHSQMAHSLPTIPTSQTPTQQKTTHDTLTNDKK
jgi:hypothetical protein